MKDLIKKFLLAFLVVSWPALAHAEHDLGAQSFCPNLSHVDGQVKSICSKNNKPYLLLEFFSVYCPACRVNVPQFKKLEAKTSSHAHARMVSRESFSETLSFLTNYSVNTDVALDSQGAVMDRYKISHLPTLFVIGPNNQVIYTHEGVLRDSDINYIESLVK